MNKDNLITMMALDNYETPKLPTLEKANPELLKKVPSRWKNKALIAAASLSILSAIPLSGCTGLHHGGAGMAPIYVAYLTEQEVLGIVQTRLAEIGLKTIIPTDLETMTTTIHHRVTSRETVGISLFNEENRLGIVIINLGERNGHSGHWNTSVRREEIETQLRNEKVDHIHILFVPDDHFEEMNGSLEARENQIILAHGRIENRLLENLDELIENLRSQGIIE